MVQDNLVPTPPYRKLRIFALDPSLAAKHATAGISEITIKIPWEENLQPGPVGEYIEVVDADPPSRCFYKPVDLNQRNILAQDGLAPSETNPQFHQQMAYAVAMATIQHFEQALGRVALWSSHRINHSDGSIREEFVPRLRIYPHALRERNAFYSPQKKALLFGYFPAGFSDEGMARESIIYSVLSHDIIAHETTHALLDGLHPRFTEPVNVDVLAFHEAFADIVALFQHFSYPGVLQHEIAQTRGNLAGENLLSQLAQQFGTATGRRGALRDALGGRNPATGQWEPRQPNVNDLQNTLEPHARGAILLAAVFGAFLKVYRFRTADLYRIASEGTGVLRAGDIHPDLSNRLAEEATRCANYILQMCIRALDYCPPVGITFGDYLRAIVTADHDLNPDDPNGYRLAIIESFKQWGIHPRGMRSLSEEALLWPTGEEAAEEAGIALSQTELSALFTDERILKNAPDKMERFSPWNLQSNRKLTWEGVEKNAALLWLWLMDKGKAWMPVFGLVDEKTAVPTVFISKTTGKPAVEVHSVRTAIRRGYRGAQVNDLVVEITQRRRGYFDPQEQKAKDQSAKPVNGNCNFKYRAGCTVLIDPVTMRVRRVIRTAGTVNDNEVLEQVRQFMAHSAGKPENAFFLARDAHDGSEPFAMLHKSGC